MYITCTNALMLLLPDAWQYSWFGTLFTYHYSVACSWYTVIMWNNYHVIYRTVSNQMFWWHHSYNVGPPQWCLLVYKPHEYYIVISTINHSYWSYVHQLNAIQRGPHIVVTYSMELAHVICPRAWGRYHPIAWGSSRLVGRYPTKTSIFFHMAGKSPPNGSL